MIWAGVRPPGSGSPGVPIYPAGIPAIRESVLEPRRHPGVSAAIRIGSAANFVITVSDLAIGAQRWRRESCDWRAECRDMGYVRRGAVT